MGKTNLYEERGVSSGKEEVHEAASIFAPGLFKNTFCTFLPDIAGDMNYASIMHADGSGSKVILPYLYYKETGDPKHFKTIVNDGLVMNTDDMGCSGSLDNYMISSTIDRNKLNIPAECLQALMQGTKDFMDILSTYGVNMIHSGGETADMGDVVRSLTSNFTVFSRVKRSDIIVIDIKPGDHVMGFPSYGICAYDDLLNSGIGSNGLTSARHDILHHQYAEKYPEVYDRENVESGNIREEIIYSGDRLITGRIADMLMHPTRTYIPFLKEIQKANLLSKVSGIIHNTGGGHSKVKKFSKYVHIHKEFTNQLPEIFTRIQSTKNTSWEEMFNVFNMGYRLEIYGQKPLLNEIQIIADDMGLSPGMFGEVCETKNEKTKVTVSHSCLGHKENIIIWRIL